MSLACGGHDTRFEKLHRKNELAKNLKWTPMATICERDSHAFFP